MSGRVSPAAGGARRSFWVACETAPGRPLSTDYGPLPERIKSTPPLLLPTLHQCSGLSSRGESFRSGGGHRTVAPLRLPAPTATVAVGGGVVVPRAFLSPPLGRDPRLGRSGLSLGGLVLGA